MLPLSTHPCVLRTHIFSCDQAALRTLLSVCPSVRPSHLFHYVPIIVSSWNFQELLPLTNVIFTTPFSRFRTITPVWIHIFFSDSDKFIQQKYIQVFEFTYDDEMIHIAWCCLGEVPYCFSRSSVKFQGHTALKIVEFDPDWAFPDCNSSFNSPMATKCCTKLEVA